jgi:hypothetical protein
MIWEKIYLDKWSNKCLAQYLGLLELRNGNVDLGVQIPEKHMFVKAQSWFE